MASRRVASASTSRPPHSRATRRWSRPSAVVTSRRLLRAKEAAAAAAAAAAVAAAATNGSTRLAINDTNATAAPSAPNALRPRAAAALAVGGEWSTVDFAAEGEDSVPPLYADPTLNGGMDVLSAPTAASSSGLPEAACQYVNPVALRAHEAASEICRGGPAGERDRHNSLQPRQVHSDQPGGINEEDNRIVGFGLRLTAEERHQLEVAIRRDAAENAKEVARAAALGGGRRRAESENHIEDGNGGGGAPASRRHSAARGRPAARGATGTAFLQMAASARAHCCPAAPARRCSPV